MTRCDAGEYKSFQVNVMVFLVLFFGAVRYITGMPFFSYVIFFLYSGLMFWFVIKNKLSFSSNEVFVVLPVLFCIIFSVFSLRYGGREGIFFSVKLLGSCLFAIYLTNEEVSILKTAKFIFYLYCIFIVYCIFSVGYDASSMNDYLPTSSRNYVTGIAIILLLLVFAEAYRLSKPLPYFGIVFVTIISFLSTGRSAIGLSTMVIVLALFVLYGRQSYVTKLVMAFLSISLLVYSGLELYPVIVDVINATNFSQGLSTPRYEKYLEYVSGLTPISFFIGLSYEGTVIEDFYLGNPHNSFIHGHHYMGFPYLIFVLVVISYCVACFFFFSKKVFVYLLLLAILMARSFIDTIMIPGYFDLVFFYIYFVMIKSAGECLRGRGVRFGMYAKK